MAELVDALALGASAARRKGASPFTRTRYTRSVSTLHIGVARPHIF